VGRQDGVPCDSIIGHRRHLLLVYTVFLADRARSRWIALDRAGSRWIALDRAPGDDNMSPPLSERAQSGVCMPVFTMSSAARRVQL